MFATRPAEVPKKLFVCQPGSAPTAHHRWEATHMVEAPVQTALRVLLVDDCPDTLMSMALLLQLWGHETREARDGETALEVAATYEPDVILLDIGMPGLDGLEVARRLRQQERERVLLICVSGFGREVDRQEALEAGCDLHLVKPVDLDDLRNLLESYRLAKRGRSLLGHAGEGKS
jgi:CheY-like chemotaxis protein